MYNLTSKLIIYRSIPSDSILFKLSDICRDFDSGHYDKDVLITKILGEINRLLDTATKYGFNKNLWHNYLAYLLATTETPFTLVSEKVGASDGSVKEFAKNDLVIFKQLFDYDFSAIEKVLNINCFSIIENYKAVMKSEQIYNKSVSEKVQELSEKFEKTSDAEELYETVTDFYRRYGVGKFGLNKAFRVNDDEDGEFLLPITNTGNMQLDDLVGYEIQKKKLIENTEAFIAGKKANNVLLYGDAGTGKSTSIKAILNQYYPAGLRMIEVYKHQFKDLSRIINEIKNRNYRFIIYMDDLSFEEFEIEYKYLKAVIEGGLEPRPDNVLIYATSNRRHLIRETWGDRSDMSDDEIHRSDTMQEKLSLAARFGVTISYFKPSQKEYFNIVTELAKRYPEITIPEEELIAKARVWEMNHGGFSGRSAQQFIDYLAGTSEL
ncbi:MAG: ATP-binding protein [Lachnospiraceae bacterium]|nr:ATP-binding protein [Lachnospiraceae bacterium]